MAGLDWFDFDLPASSHIVGDKAYNDYAVEDVLKAAELQILPMRKSNSKRPLPPYWRYLQAKWRKAVEAAGNFARATPAQIYPCRHPTRL